MTSAMAWMPVFGLCILRPLGALLLLPIVNRAALGGTLIRNALVLVIAIGLVPAKIVWPVLHSAHATWFHWFALVCTELALGAFIGFISAIPFWVVDMAGFLIDTMRGASMASVLNPLLEQQSSLLGILFSQVFGLLFLLTGGFNALVAAIYDSYALLPPGAPFGAQARWMAFLLDSWQTMFTLCLRFSMPAVVGMVLVDIALGLINRSAQQLNVFFLAMPIKSAFALLLLIISAGFAYRPLIEQASTLGAQVDGLLSARP